MPRTVQIAARPEPIAVVPEETALIVVDMQHAGTNA
jgi:ureidoacrylate peracid hydrolase